MRSSAHAASRDYEYPSFRDILSGFRLVRTP